MPAVCCDRACGCIRTYTVINQGAGMHSADRHGCAGARGVPCFHDRTLHKLGIIDEGFTITSRRCTSPHGVSQQKAYHDVTTSFDQLQHCARNGAQQLTYQSPCCDLSVLKRGTSQSPDDMQHAPSCWWKLHLLLLAAVLPSNLVRFQPSPTPNPCIWGSNP
jgi:hypothetical protein